MNRRTFAILIFVVALLILGLLGVLYIMQSNSGQPATGQADIPPGAEIPPGSETTPIPGMQPGQPMPELFDVVVSLQTVPRGYRLTENELILEKRLPEDIPTNVITNLSDAIGLYARKDIYQGETLTYDALVQDPTILGQNEYGPSSLIPPGFVAAAVPMNRLSSVAYGLDPGDFVDIMLSFVFYQIDEQFQTYLQNAAVFFLEDVQQAVEAGEGEDLSTQEVVIIAPYGRFETLPTGDLAHIAPSESQRPVQVSMILQNAKVIQVGEWVPPAAVQGPTPTPSPVPANTTPEPTPFQPGPTATPQPKVLLLALSPQQQLFLKYAVESNAVITFALRGVKNGVQDNQLYAVQNVDINYLLQRFNIVPPPNFNYSVDTVIEERAITPTAPPAQPAPGAEGADS